MKKIFTVLVLMFAALALQAQNPTTTWPYLYNDFMQGKVFFKDGSTKDYMINIHILKSALHFIEPGTDNIKEAKSKDVMLVSVGTDTYYSKQGKMLRAAASNDFGFVGEEVVADMAALNSESGAAYGASANSMSTMKLSSVDGGGPTASTNHMNLKNSKEDGKIIPLEKEYYLVTNGQVYPATKKELELFLTPDKKAGMKAFLKQNKISWKSPESLLKVIDYINAK